MHYYAENTDIYKSKINSIQNEKKCKFEILNVDVRSYSNFCACNFMIVTANWRYNQRNLIHWESK